MNGATVHEGCGEEPSKTCGDIIHERVRRRNKQVTCVGIEYMKE
jgi:hypothetical protein